MNQQSKEEILSEARAHLQQTREKIVEAISQLNANIAKEDFELKTSDTEAEETKMVQAAILQHGRGRLEELQKLYPSPYFIRCDLQLDDDNSKSYYFAKFPLNHESILSWTAPIASIRFEEPGQLTYNIPGEGSHEAILLRKDQYMIVDGKIIFLASEGIDTPRELIHQEYLSSRQNGFALPEIVAQMEKAQDQVIRAHHAGPLLITGPAGSGKTTLALHRVAYLTQSPETGKTYPSRGIIVFVQDEGTRDYFSHLLPELGIHGIKITTFASWALNLLNLERGVYQTGIGQTENERDQYEYQKIQALKTSPVIPYRKGSEFSLLEKAYEPHFNPEQKSLLAWQRKNNIFDRYDLTILLRSLSQREDGFIFSQTAFYRQKNGLMKEETRQLHLEYSLMVIDEFQNYLPEQLQILNLCLKKRHRSVLYVGDLAQQTQFGTIHDWKEIQEAISPERQVRLHKVYRNTKQILAYIQQLGYAVEIPAGIREGKEVEEVQLSSTHAEIDYIRQLQKTSPEASIGILAKNPDYLSEFKEAFHNSPKVHCLSILESQGVEFEIVCLVGVSEASFNLSDSENQQAYAIEKRRINKDLLYLGLTRAMSELYILGSKLSLLTD